MSTIIFENSVGTLTEDIAEISGKKIVINQINVVSIERAYREGDLLDNLMIPAVVSGAMALVSFILWVVSQGIDTPRPGDLAHLVYPVLQAIAVFALGMYLGWPRKLPLIDIDMAGSGSTIYWFARGEEKKMQAFVSAVTEQIAKNRRRTPDGHDAIKYDVSSQQLAVDADVQRVPCPNCAELIMPAAKVCRFCNLEVSQAP